MTKQQSRYFANFVDAVDIFYSHATTLNKTHACLRHVEALLDLVAQPTRVGACTLYGPVRFEIADVRHIPVVWPAECSGADIVFLVHSGPVTARMRERCQSGPAHFEIVESSADIPRRFAEVDPRTIAYARGRHLRGQLLALVTANPETDLSMLIDALGADLAQLRTGCLDSDLSPTVAVLGPDAERRAFVASQLSVFSVVQAPDERTDVAVVVARAEGWKEADVPMLVEVYARVGRLVITAPLPRGVLPEAVVSERDSAEAWETAIRRALARPALASLPAPRLGVWERTAVRIEREHTSRQHVEFSEDPLAACRRLGMRPPMQWNATFATELIVITGGLSLGLSRVLTGWVLVAVVALVVGVRAYAKQTQLRRNWARAKLNHLQSSRMGLSRQTSAAWVRQRMALHSGQSD